MADLTDTQLDAAAARGRIARIAEPRAPRAWYDGERGHVVVELTNGSMFSFPTGLAQGLENATPDQLAEMEILGAGFGLHWEALDVDLSIPGLVSGLFGTKAHMARQAGKATSPAKAAAARVNGAKGGRPRSAAAA
jgi:hypothetical protein